MKVYIDVLAVGGQATPDSMQKNINSIDRVLEGNLAMRDLISLIDTKSILVAIQGQLKSGDYNVKK